MVVQFPPAGPESGSERHPRRSPEREHGIAPVTYLPGAQPGEAAQDALARVRAVQERDETEARTGIAQRRSGTGRAGTDTGGTRDKKTARAGNVAIHQLARRGMSRWELEQVLAKRDVDERTAAAELDRLESIGLVDDAALAVSVVYAMRARKGSGRAAIELELRRRHLDDFVIAEAMSELDGEDELERATELAVGRARQLTSLEYEVAARRLSGYLGRKGYDGEAVRSAVRTALADHPRGTSSSSGVRFR
ncbi:regulatory protein RecX [Rathayibacter sp. CAU 1779]